VGTQRIQPSDLTREERVALLVSEFQPAQGRLGVGAQLLAELRVVQHPAPHQVDLVDAHRPSSLPFARIQAPYACPSRTFGSKKIGAPAPIAPSMASTQ
jgi:hypothetical protein